MADQDNDDVMNDIKAAFAAAEASEPAEVAQAPEEPVDAPEEAEGQPRGPDGKFAAKDKAEEPEKVGPVEKEEVQRAFEQEQPKAEGEKPLTPPIGWSPQSKAAFAELPDHIKADVVKREKDIAKGLEAKSLELKRYQPLEELIAPRRERWAMAGVDEATAIKQLLAASDFLERNPRSAIAYLAQQYNVPLAQAGSQANVQPQQNTISRPSPEIATLQQELASLREQLTTQTNSAYVDQVEAFASDPKHIYFENVRQDMGILIREGRAKTLEEAYDKACWADPEIRAILTKEQAGKQTGREQVAEKAKRAIAAGSSVTGAPGNASPLGVNGSGSVEDDIRAAMTELQGRA